jgi:hypothetical protein
MSELSAFTFEFEVSDSDATRVRRLVENYLTRLAGDDFEATYTCHLTPAAQSEYGGPWIWRAAVTGCLEPIVKPDPPDAEIVDAEPAVMT